MSRKFERILVTGGAGFIGSNLVLSLAGRAGRQVVTLDKLTYAGNPGNLTSLAASGRHHLVVGDIGDAALVRGLLDQHRPQAIINLAAESHVDRSILGPADFVQTNVVGTFVLLEEARKYWSNLPVDQQSDFRFLHISTDEVYGSLGPADHPFTESTPYAPNSPYAATKAGADHLVRAFHQTYSLPTLTTNCSNNYGPYQFPEKLIPLMILNAVKGRPLPLYGDGKNVRDWLFVEDHCSAIVRVLESGQIGETYNVGGHCELTNLEVVERLCAVLDDLHPRPDGGTYRDQIAFVTDRPGHDRRYAMDPGKLQYDLGWRHAVSFNDGLRRTVAWYLSNTKWVQEIETEEYRHWIAANYGSRASL